MHIISLRFEGVIMFFSLAESAEFDVAIAPPQTEDMAFDLPNEKSLMVLSG